MIRRYRFLLLIISVFYCFSNCTNKQEEQQSQYEIQVNYHSKRKVYTYSVQKADRVELDKKVHLFFETGFDEDTVSIFIDGNLYETIQLKTDESLGLAEYIELGERGQVKKIGVSLNKGELLVAEISDSDNVIAIYFKDNKLILDFIDGYPSYY